MSQLQQANKSGKTKEEIRYENELVKRQYFDYLKESRGYSQNSIITYEGSILQWQDFSKDVDFRAFNKKCAVEFKDWLAIRKGKRGDTLSVSFQYQTIRKVNDFFFWLSRQDGYRQHIQETDVEFLKLGKKESRQALQSKRRRVPSMEVVKKTIEGIEPKTEIDKRDRALLSFTLITGARISAIVSLPMSAFDPHEMVVDQDPSNEVKTKFSKRITTAFFPIEYKEAQRYFIEWYEYLKNERGFKENDPLFPATKVENGKENISYYSTGKVERIFWSNSSPARKIFEKRFKAVEEPYYNPHSFRRLLVKEFMKKPLTEEQKKAISQNLGHENVVTTFGSYGYGHIEESRQIELLREIEAVQNGSGEVRYNISEDELQTLLRKVASKDDV